MPRSRLVARPLGRVTLRVVELVLFRVDDHVVVGQFAEVDTGAVLGDRDFLADGRDVAGDEDRQALLGDLVDPGHHRAVAVSELQPLLRPAR